MNIFHENDQKLDYLITEKTIYIWYFNNFYNWPHILQYKNTFANEKNNIFKHKLTKNISKTIEKILLIYSQSKIKQIKQIIS